MMSERAPLAGASTPHVLQVITRLNIGGAARHAILLTRELDRRGFPSELLWGKEGTEEGRIEPVGIRHTYFAELRRPVSPLADLRALGALGRVIRARRPAVVHTHLSKAGVLGRLAARRSRVPAIVHTYHGHVLEGYFSPVVSQSFLEIERALARTTDALVAVSEPVRDELLARKIGHPSQWHVMPLGFDLEHLLAAAPARENARESMGLQPDAPTVGIVGRLVPVKDHMTFLRAAADVWRRRPDVRFVVAGDGELRAELEDAALRLEAPIRFLGWVSDVRTLYAALDVVVLTSANEGLPVVLIEAAAAGNPVVATRVGGVPSVVRHGVTGTLVPPREHRAIADAVIDLLETPRAGQAQGAAARELVRERFSTRAFADRMEHLYRGLLSASGRRSASG